MKVAIVQDGPIFNDLKGSINKAKHLINDAAKNKAQIIVFGECWLTGYPAWIDYCADVAKWDHDPVKSVWAKMFTNGLEIGSTEFQELQKAIEEAGIFVVMGVNEVIRKGRGNGTIFNSILMFDENGKLVNHHRKLMPTYNEKLIYGLGDGHGLNTVETNSGWRVGALVCWEHWMPLTRQAMHDEGEDIHFALWPAVKESHQIASRQYAFEGRCYTISVGQIMATLDMPYTLKLPDDILKKENILNGGSCVIGPDGAFILEPQYDVNEIIYATLPSRDTLIKERMNLATSGHYQRPDVFKFDINKDRQF